MKTAKIPFVLVLLLLVSLTAAFLVNAQVPYVGFTFTLTPSATMVISGSSVSYLYNVTNMGEVALTGGIYDDVFGSVGYFVDLQPGGWVAYNVTHVITENTTNIATAYGVDQFGRNITASASAFVQVITIPQVIPEVPIGTVAAAVTMISAFGAYVIRSRGRTERPNTQ